MDHHDDVIAYGGRANGDEVEGGSAPEHEEPLGAPRGYLAISREARSEPHSRRALCFVLGAFLGLLSPQLAIRERGGHAQ